MTQVGSSEMETILNKKIFVEKRCSFERITIGKEINIYVICTYVQLAGRENVYCIQDPWSEQLKRAAKLAKEVIWGAIHSLKRRPVWAVN